MPLSLDAQEQERARQLELDGRGFDEFAETAYDDITRLAADVCGTPIALISVVDGERQWFKSRIGLDATETSREFSFCVHAICNPLEVMVVEDTTEDPRFAANPFVTGEPYIRFYAGAPLLTSSGHALGTICVIDNQPRSITREQMNQLQFLAQQVVEVLEKRKK